MSMFYDDDEPDQPQMSAEVRAQSDALLEARSDFEDKMRTLGLYLENVSIVLIDTPMGQRPAMAADMTIGDVAFSDRVQHPEKYGIDQQFRVMEREITANDHEEIVERMRRNLAAGRDPLDDGDDDL